MPYARDPDRHEYRLTDVRPRPVRDDRRLDALGRQHLPDPKGPPIVLRHDPCGQIADPVLVCAHCRKEITAHNVTPEPGPGFEEAAWRGSQSSGDPKDGVLIDDPLELRERRVAVDREERTCSRGDLEGNDARSPRGYRTGPPPTTRFPVDGAAILRWPSPARRLRAQFVFWPSMATR